MLKRPDIKETTTALLIEMKKWAEYKESIVEYSQANNINIDFGDEKTARLKYNLTISDKIVATLIDALDTINHTVTEWLLDE